MGCGPRGGDGEIPLCADFDPHLQPETVPGGEFDWGGRLPKRNGGAQRFPQAGWKSAIECIGKRELDCEADTPSRDESRAK